MWRRLQRSRATRWAHPAASMPLVPSDATADAPPELYPRIHMVCFDSGGVMYDDTVYARSWMKALRESGAVFTDEAFEREYVDARAAQSGSFRRRLTRTFLGEDAELAPVEARAAKYWAYPSTAIYPDEIHCLADAVGRYRLGIIANQLSSVRAAMDRDGLSSYFEVW